MSTAQALTPSKLRLGDLARLASVGLRTRRLRATLSALGIAIGVAAIVAVLGLSASSQAGLLSEIDRLGTNLLDVTNGQTLLGQTAELRDAAPAMIKRIGPVTQVQSTGTVDGNVFRSPLSPPPAAASTVRFASRAILCVDEFVAASKLTCRYIRLSSCCACARVAESFNRPTIRSHVENASFHGCLPFNRSSVRIGTVRSETRPTSGPRYPRGSTPTTVNDT